MSPDANDLPKKIEVATPFIQLVPDEPSIRDQLRDNQFAMPVVEPETRTQWFHATPPAREGWYEAQVRPFEGTSNGEALAVHPEQTVMAYFRDHWVMDQRCIEWLIRLTDDTWQEVFCVKWRGLYEFPQQPWQLEDPQVVLKRFPPVEREDVYYMHRLELKFKQEQESANVYENRQAAKA